MYRTQSKPRSWVLKCKVPYEWKDAVEKKMREMGFYTYSEFLRELVRRVVSDAV